VTAGLVLAAGSGSRLGRPKALVVHAGELLLDRAVRVAREAGCDPVVVVLGAAADEVRATASLAGCQVVDNPGWASGMGSSLRAGLAALLPSPAGAVVVLLVDQPRVTPEAVRRVTAATGRPAAAASYAGALRNPVRLDRSVWAEVSASATGDRGARAWLRASPDRVQAVPCDDVADPTDIDTPADLAALT